MSSCNCHEVVTNDISDNRQVVTIAIPPLRGYSVTTALQVTSAYWVL